ncbi:RNA polymerase sigma-70 factor, ECF subfamily [Mesonia phycicola]|uniref:RNA polymerase sigma-70 factor, ECF subfamily n=1 Tax=Mesonia phycicola TaxID=579105 RepID=A0A1M6AVT4_9FLAO|nr:sigma-70 family RNA polymerase sigma factor [Mesonia phycicola]SHI40550.1 RNA polymerase sigma-70 factor, ECF subfamily [Mesonia phycicola]
MGKSLKENVCEERLFGKIYKDYATHLYNFLYYKFGDQLQPQDKVQEAFIKLWKKCKEVPPSKAKSFLFTVANNLMLNEFKHQKIVLKYQEVHTSKINNQDPQFLIEEKEYLIKFQHALSKLTESQRVAFMMNRTEGKKHKEIADILGVSTKAVEKRIYSALKKLREDLKEI